MESRTLKGLKNARIALFFYCINLCLGFVSRKIFINYLGAEILGLNTTANNLLSFLNLAELGIGAAVSFVLYQPLFKKDQIVVNEIVSVQGLLYRKIAFGIIFASFFLMLFFPLIFKNIDFPLWYAYGSFTVLLVSSLLGYFWNYRQIVLIADQKEFKVTLTIQGFKVIKVLFQILAIVYLVNGYACWIILEFFMAFITAYFLNKVIKKEYPWLHPNLKEAKFLRQKHDLIIKKTKQLFFHKIADFALTQSSPLIIYTYASLTLVAIYGNYMLIVSGVTMLLSSIMNGVGAGVGNLVAEGNKQRIKQVFWELYSLRIWLASLVCFSMLYLTTPFMSIWIGKEYLLDTSSFIVLLVYTFISLTRTFETFIWAYGLFQDIWAPVIEAIINVACSIVLGYYYGLFGILLGVTISLFLIVYIWKPYFLYKYGFRDNINEYILRWIIYIFFIFLSWIVSMYIIDNIIKFEVTSLIEWIILSVKVVGIYSIISLFIGIAIDRYLRLVINRFFVIFKACIK